MAIFKLGILVTADDKASKKLRKLPKITQNIAKAVGLAAAAYAALQSAQKAIEFVKLGANIEATENRFFKLVGSGHQASEMLQALDDASMGTITRFGALETASQLFGLGLATNAKDMGIAGAMISRLGRASLSTEGRMNSLTMLLANQSTRRLDDFGLSVEKVRERQEALEEQGLSTEQAFKTAVFDEASEKLATLGDTSDLAATKISGIESSLIDAKNAAAEIATTVLDSSGAFESMSAWADSLQDFAESLKEGKFNTEAWMKLFPAFATSGFDVAQALKGVSDETETGTRLGEQYRQIIIRTNDRFDEFATEARLAGEGVAGLTRRVKDTDQATKDMISTIDMVTGATDDYTIASSFLKDQLQEQRQATLDTATAAREASADFSSFLRDQSKTAEEFTKEREDIETEHQENLAKIAKKGQSTAIRFDAAAEEERLSRLKERLIVSLAQQAEFSDKTKVSQRQSKEFSIANLQEEIATREQRLADFHAGRLVKAGINTAGLVAEEQARFDQEIAIHDAGRAEQERIQHEALGRMILENTEGWGLMAGATAEQIEAMKLKVAEQFGIITEDGAKMARDTKDAVIAEFQLMSRVGVEAFDAITNAINRIPRTVVVDVQLQERIAGAVLVDPGERGEPPGMAAGGISPGGRTLVGELGAEMVDMPRGARVTPASQTNDNRQFTFRQTVITRATTHSIMDDFARAEAEAA